MVAKKKMGTKSVNIKPIHNRVMIKLEGIDSVSKGGIYIPDIAKERATQSGTVVAIGAEVKTIAIGDTVMIAKFGGHEVEILGEKYTMINEEDVLAITKEE